MDYVIVTVKYKDSEQSYDMELPADVPAKDLSNLIGQALRDNKYSTAKISGYQIYADPPGRLLKEFETLNDAGAWDGAILTLL
jgi:uncharacterized ubiquitin-like protein YukD